MDLIKDNMKTKSKLIFLCAVSVFFISPLVAQVMYAPSPIGTSTNLNVGIGTTNAPSTKLYVKTAVSNDGIRIEQTSLGAAALGLYNSAGGGHNWALLSTSNNNTQGGGKLMFYDYSTPPAQATQASRICIGKSGNVGVGYFYDFEPKVRLHVNNGSIKLTGTDTVHGAPNIFWGGNPFSQMGTVTAPNGEWGVEYSSASNGTGGMKGLNFWRPYLSHDATGATQALVNNVLFLADNNYVGISTASPTAKLEINALGGHKPLNILSDRGDWTYGIHYQHQGASVAHKAIAVSHNGTEIFTVNTNGLVAIGNNGFNVPGLGMAAPPYSLVVGRGILTERLKVALSSDATNWSDYVFDKDYKLNSLQYVDEYVKKNKHLPNMPSANEVYSNGLDVAEMDAALLRQVEELWLHVIELEKENKELKAKVNEKTK